MSFQFSFFSFKFVYGLTIGEMFNLFFSPYEYVLLINIETQLTLNMLIALNHTLTAPTVLVPFFSSFDSILSSIVNRSHHFYHEMHTLWTYYIIRG